MRKYKKHSLGKLSAVFVIVGVFLFFSIFYSIISNNVDYIKSNVEKQRFFHTIAPVAIELYKRDKIFPSITLAQAMMESDTGKSELTRQANNLFGIKSYNWTGRTIKMPTKENYNGVEVTVMGTFRAYDNWKQSIEDHADFLMQNSTYKEHGVFTASNYVEQAKALQLAGYATDPNYERELVNLIEQYNLHKYDK